MRCICCIGTPALAADNLSYHSDYFSFIGRDAIGVIAFALDNNRGVDGPDYQAEHFGVFYDQASGWVKLHGMGDYTNLHGTLERIPDSPDFIFEGQTETGLVIHSKSNVLSLEIEPLTTQLSESKQKRLQNWGAAKAVLRWKDRVIPGRVIHEKLIYYDWNRLTRTYTDTWDNFQGFYLTLDLGNVAMWRDLYLRSEGEGVAHHSKGFTTAKDWSGVIHSTRFKASDKTLNFGFFRWPQRWDIDVSVEDFENGLPGRLTLHKVSRKNLGNWIVGGFAMTLVEGELVRNGETIPVLGFVELIK